LLTTLFNNIARRLPDQLQPFFTRLRGSPTGKRIARGVFWVAVGTGITRSLSFASGVIIARILGRETLGELAMVSGTVGLFGTLAGIGLGLTANKYVAEFRDKNPRKAGEILGMAGMLAAGSGLVMAVALFFAGPALAVHRLAAPHLAGPLQVASLLLILSAMNGAQGGALAGFEAFKTMTVRSTLCGLVTIPLNLAGAYYGGVLGMIWANVIGTAINWLALHLAIRHECRRYGVGITFTGVWKHLTYFWNLSLPAFLASLLAQGTVWWRWSLYAAQPGGYKELGILAVTQSLQGAVMVLVNIVSQPLTPTLANAGNRASATLINFNLILTWSVALLPTTVLMLFPDAVRFLYGKEFATASFNHCLTLYAFCIVLCLLQGSVNRIYNIKDHGWWSFNYQVGWSILATLIAYALLGWGAVGLIWSGLIGHLICTTAYIYWGYQKKLLTSPVLKRPIFGALNIALGMLAIWMLTDPSVVARVAVLPGFLALGAFCLYRLWKPIVLKEPSSDLSPAIKQLP
jgi:O-antigen/teichoic acid export membrane protein